MGLANPLCLANLLGLGAALKKEAKVFSADSSFVIWHSARNLGVT